MVCPTCGGKLNPNDKFCRYCGTTVESVQTPPQPPVAPPDYSYGAQNAYNPGTQQAYQPQQQAYQPQQQAYQPQQQAYQPQQQAYQPQQQAYQPQQPAPQKPKKQLPKVQLPKVNFKLPKLPRLDKKTMIIGGAAAAALLVVVLVVSLILSSNPAAKVASAFAATGKEFMEVADTLGIPDAGKAITQDSASHALTMEVGQAHRYSGLGGLDGMGITVMLDANIPKKQIGLRAIPYVGSAELITASMLLDDDMVYFGIPELLPEDLYGFSTVTMMADLEALGADVGEAEEISFNIFNLVKIVQKHTEAGSKESKKIMSAATTDLVKAMEVERDGKRNLRINGKSTKCTVYTVLIPQDALEDWLDALEEASEVTDYEAILEEVFEAMNLPEDIADELLREVSRNLSAPNFKNLYNVVDTLGDVELEVFVSGGKVAAIRYDEKISGEKVEIGLYIGDKSGYVNAISLEMDFDGDVYELTAEGNHTAKGGTFTTEISFVNTWNDRVYTNISAELEYNTKAKEDNLTVEVNVDGMEIVLEGGWSASGSAVSLVVDEFTIEESGEVYLELSGSYKVGKYSQGISSKGAVLLSDLTEDDMEELVEEMQSNAASWAEDLLRKHPELSRLF